MIWWEQKDSDRLDLLVDDALAKNWNPDTV